VADQMTKGTEATVLAALALAAIEYADATPCYDAIRELWPDVDWTDWIANAERKRSRDRDRGSNRTDDEL
jgi:hypothetical protein